MKKRKSLLLIIAILALIILIATGYTFSRLYQSVRGRGSLHLINWAFKATTNDDRPLSEIVLQGDNGEPVLPGSRGSFEITVDATGSEADIAYHTIVTDENLPANIFFYTENERIEQYEDFRDLAIDKVKGTLSDAKGQKKTHKICWEWPFDGDELLDTPSNTNYGFNIEVVGEQVKK